jgi:Tol biopolymer transport system component
VLWDTLRAVRSAASEGGANGRRPTAPCHRGYSPAPAMRGQLVAVQSTWNRLPSLVILDLDRRRRWRLRTGGFFALPTWSPDGTRIAFSALTPLLGSMALEMSNVHMIDLASPGSTVALTHMTDPRRGYAWITGVSWAPTGRQIAYLRCDLGALQTHVHILDLDAGTDEVVFRSPRILSSASWSLRCIPKPDSGFASGLGQHHR